MAAKILTRTEAVSRFPTSAAFASYCGVAPIEVSSGDVLRHRLSRAGDRQLNYALHVMARSRQPAQDGRLIESVVISTLPLTFAGERV